jgi:hypothetical protein
MSLIQIAQHESHYKPEVNSRPPEEVRSNLLTILICVFNDDLNLQSKYECDSTAWLFSCDDLMMTITSNSIVSVMWLYSCVISNIKWAAVTCFRFCSTKNLLRSSNVYNYFGEIYVYSNKLYESVTIRKKRINKSSIQFLPDDNCLLHNHGVLFFSESMPGYWTDNSYISSITLR